MKYLSDYSKISQTKLFNKLGIFFAFSQSQFDEKAIKCIAYVSLSSGMVCPKKNVKEFRLEHSKLIENAIKQDLKENGKDAIIQRELSNYECQISMNYSDAFDILQDYGITELEVKKGFGIFFQNCIDNDRF